MSCTQTFKWTIVFSVFVNTLFLVSEGSERAATSTNPAKPMVMKLQLPNYDPALDSLDYDIPEIVTASATIPPQINWPWKTDETKQKKRVQAIDLLEKNGTWKSHSRRLKPRDYREPVDSLFWGWFYDEYEDNRLVAYGLEVNDDLLLKTLPHIPEIRSCRLFFTPKITDKGLEALFYLPILSRLDMGTAEPEKYPLSVTDKGIDLISKHPSLERITFRNMNITDASLISIAKNTKKLKFFAYSGKDITDAGVKALCNLPHLEAVLISNEHYFHERNKMVPNITNRIFQYTANLRKLRSLDARYCDLSGKPDLQTINSISNHKNINSFAFTGSKIHPYILHAFCNISSIESYVGVFNNHSVSLNFDKNNPISYEKVMYRLRKGNEVPAYYEELEKPYFEEFYVRPWMASDGKPLDKAAFVDLKDGNAFFKTTVDGKPFDIPLDKLSKEDRKYVQDIVATPEKP